MDRILSPEHNQRAWYAIASPCWRSNFWYHSFLWTEKASLSPLDSFPTESFASAKQYRFTSYISLSNLAVYIYHLLYFTILFFRLVRSYLFITSSANCFLITKPGFLSRSIQFNLLLSDVWLSISKFLGNLLFYPPFLNTFPPAE